MKLSELIHMCECTREDHGDMDVFVRTERADLHQPAFMLEIVEDRMVLTILPYD